MMAACLEIGDRNGVVHQDAVWQIREHCNRGSKPWFTLHERRSFWRFTWWSDAKQIGDFGPLMEFVARWHAFGPGK